MASTTDTKERNNIRSNWESSSDKYARTIAQWLVKLGLLNTAKREITVQYGNNFSSDILGGYCVTPMGERYFRNSKGISKHPKIIKMVSYEMFATKGKDKEYLRYRRSLILKYLIDKKKKCTFEDISKFLEAYGLKEVPETIHDDIKGFVNVGIEIVFSDKDAELKDLINDFLIPHYTDLTVKSELSVEKEVVRSKLKNISHEYLSLMDIAFDSSQNRLFEMKVMELFLRECNFYGDHLGGTSKPDGVLYTEECAGHCGIIVDMKAYSKGYPLPIGQRDEMLRYIRENKLRDKNQNSNEWWTIFPDYVNKFYFMFVSGSFKGDMSEKLNKISMVHNIEGTAMPIVTALLVADKIKGNELLKEKLFKKINNSEYKIE